MKHIAKEYTLQPGEIRAKLSKRAIWLIDKSYNAWKNKDDKSMHMDYACVTHYADKTMVILRNENHGCIGIGWALRGRNDKPNQDIGLRVALGRAVLHMIYPHEKDNCSICHGVKGGVKGNEIRENGKLICDYCHCEMMEKSYFVEHPDEEEK